jgi:hypothetical protein
VPLPQDGAIPADRNRAWLSRRRNAYSRYRILDARERRDHVCTRRHPARLQMSGCPAHRLRTMLGVHRMHASFLSDFLARRRATVAAPTVPGAAGRRAAPNILSTLWALTYTSVMVNLPTSLHRNGSADHGHHLDIACISPGNECCSRATGEG